MAKDLWKGILSQDWQNIFKITAFECQDKIPKTFKNRRSYACKPESPIAGSDKETIRYEGNNTRRQLILDKD
jgi:hypothetical protein